MTIRRIMLPKEEHFILEKRQRQDRITFNNELRQKLSSRTFLWRKILVGLFENYGLKCWTARKTAKVIMLSHSYFNGKKDGNHEQIFYYISGYSL